MFNIQTAQNLFGLLRKQFTEQRDTLNALDSAIGDGDHGFTVERAFRAAEEASRADFSDLGSLFDAAAQAMAECSGGAIGPLLAAFFAEGGAAFAGRSQADVQDFAHFFMNGLAAVQEIGGAVPGQKTLLDALAPAAAAFEGNPDQPLSEILAVAAEAAQAGALATREMVAVHGRAHFLGERSRGYQDAGAVSTAMMIDRFVAALNGEKAEPISVSQTPFQPPSGKLINHPDQMVAEDNEGLALAYRGLVRYTEEGILVRARSKKSGKVGLAIGHGGGHTPSMGGFVGPGLLDADAYGPIFTCASGLRIAGAIRAANKGAGVVLLVSNHSGDVLNARLALRRAQQEGIMVVPVILGDDIATAPRTDFGERRGLGGLLFALKIGGAAAESGWSLEETARVMTKTNERTATLSVAVRPPTHPATGFPLFDLPAGTIEVGTGVHGEVGVYRGEQMSADDLIDLLLERLTADLVDFKEKKVLVFVNGAGGTSKMELNILYRRAHLRLENLGWNIAGSVVDSLFTTQEMGGFSLSLCLVDDEMLRLWNAPASAPSFHTPIEMEA